MFYVIAYYCLINGCSVPATSIVFLDQKKCENFAEKQKGITYNTKCVETDHIIVTTTNGLVYGMIN